MNKKKWLVQALLGLFTVILLSITHLAWSIYRYGSRTTSTDADAAIVLGAAVWENQPSPVFRERINHAIALYKAGNVRTLIFTGGQGEPNELAESIVAKRYALKQGVSDADILTETQSRTTEQNLYYAKQVAISHGLSKFLIVSDPLHMKRAMLMAKNLEMNAHSSPTPTTRYQSLSSQLPFLARETYFYLVYLLFKI
jgi:uncharacterized SAM-binding protein YcdF (DUF218 family)